jgi:hypothetical protein
LIISNNRNESYNPCQSRYEKKKWGRKHAHDLRWDKEKEKEKKREGPSRSIISREDMMSNKRGGEGKAEVMIKEKKEGGAAE